MPHKIAYVIPTMDRADDLRKALDSLAKQTVQPAQIIIVDASMPAIESMLADYSNLPFTYIRVFPPSLAKQRNAGMAALHPEITIAGYLDDDLELAEDATERMYEFWEAGSPDVAGAAFTIVNQPLRHRLLGKVSDLLMINSPRPGAVLRSGFAASIGPQNENLRTNWLYGGATIWRREIIQAFDYDEWYIGHGYLEDLDFSYRVSRSGELWVVADAKVWHWPHPIRIERNVSLGRQQVVNRVYFVRKMGDFSWPFVAFGLFGQCVRNALESARDLNRAGLLRLWGNIRGFLDLMGNGTKSIEGIWK